MKILAIDTATEILSVAFVASETAIRVSHDIANGLRHSELLLPAIRTVLDRAGCTTADLDAVACTSGPGSFTGLRIGMATAKGITAGCAAVLVTVPTLDVYAEPYHGLSRIVVPVIDGKKRRYFSSIFVDGRRAAADTDLAPAQIIDTIRVAIETDDNDHNRDDSAILVAGPHAGRFLTMVPERLGMRLIAPRVEISSALALASLAREMVESGRIAPDAAAPVYLRDSEARLPDASRRHGIEYDS